MVKFVKNLTSLLITLIFMVMFISSVDMFKTATNDFVEGIWALCAIVSFIGATSYVKQDNCCFMKE